MNHRPRPSTALLALGLALATGCPPDDPKLTVTLEPADGYDECADVCVGVSAILGLVPASGAGLRMSTDGEVFRPAGELDEDGVGQACLGPMSPGEVHVTVEVSYQQRATLKTTDLRVYPFGYDWGIVKEGDVPDPVPLPLIDRVGVDPVLEVVVGSDWEADTVMMPSVAPTDGGYLMLFGARGVDYQIGAAWSEDGTSFERLGDDPVIPAGFGGASWAADSTNGPALVADGGELTVWFQGAVDNHSAIGAARSTGGEVWELLSPDPVLEPGDEGTWDAGSVAHPAVVAHGGAYEMWYASGASEGELRLGHAVSADGIGWTRYCGNPVFGALGEGSWEHSATKSPEVWFEDGLYHLLFSAGATSTWQVGHAVSADGLRWARSSEQPVLPPGEGGSWDDGATLNAFALVEGEGVSIWYSGVPAQSGPAAVGLASVEEWR